MHLALVKLVVIFFENMMCVSDRMLVRRINGFRIDVDYRLHSDFSRFRRLKQNAVLAVPPGRGLRYADLPVNSNIWQRLPANGQRAF